MFKPTAKIIPPKYYIDMLDFEDKLTINKYQNLEKDLGYTFKRESLLIQALTHSSKANEEKQLGHINYKDNQVLEFRGDAVLSMVITDILIEHLPKCNEGTLTQAKSEIVRESTQVQIAKKLKLGSYLILGKGMDKQGGRLIDSLLGDALEAVIGAIYLDTDRDMDSTAQVIVKLFKPVIAEQINKYKEIKPKEGSNENGGKLTIKEIFLRGAESKRPLLDSESSMSQFKNNRVRLLEFLSGIQYIPLGS